MAKLGFKTSSRVQVGASGRSEEMKSSTIIPVPNGLTPEQISEIREAFRKAGIGFDCQEVRPGSYSFQFSVSSHAAAE